MNKRQKERQRLIYIIACKMSRHFLPEVQRKKLEEAEGFTWQYDDEYDLLTPEEKHYVRVMSDIIKHRKP